MDSTPDFLTPEHRPATLPPPQGSDHKNQTERMSKCPRHLSSASPNSLSNLLRQAFGPSIPTSVQHTKRLSTLWPRAGFGPWGTLRDISTKEEVWPGCGSPPVHRTTSPRPGKTHTPVCGGPQVVWA